MKKLLLFIAFLMSLNAFAQTPIQAFYTASLIPEDSNITSYDLVTSASGPNQSATGANVVWNFNDLTQVTTTATTVLAASANDIANYPGTTMAVETTTQGGNPSYYYLGTSGSATSLTGADTSQMTIKYTNPALIGNFPMNYGDSTSDTVAGTFTGSGFSGTFTGTTSTSVDAYGTLTVNVGFSGPKNVTRLKTLQNLSLVYMGVPVGTLTQTTYSYYSSDFMLGPVFRSINSHIVVAALSIDQTQNTLEVYDQMANGVEDFNNRQKVVIAPNPVKDVLHIEGDAAIESVKIIDTTGRIIAEGKSNDIPVNQFPAGIYQVLVKGQSGSKSLKMVKQ
ncbi:hypothetical protein HYN59_07050 [Flavobacterium album]|uniref:Secretion system C-terminal sorting domain-containing protein n=1 Tax=Flavobacterium album TaxID=2175091 RepID=A0A2S1QWW7_9FLAO|nr:T9SS type A sorting domain-containing protein [Flavobacterium album]AWH84895.1 hypothetical protein HYN59_07050 [Flavobacterium album]